MKFVAYAAAIAAITAGPAFAGAEGNRPEAKAPVADTARPDMKQPDMKQPETGQPDVATLLFSGSQWKGASVGSTLTYDYEKVSDASFGPAFNDHITLALDAGDDPASRTVEVKMFSGEHARAAGPFPSAEQNPVLLLVLEENVQELSQSFHANPRYLKNAIRKAWRDSPSVTPMQIDVGGKSVPGTRITVQPFRGDAEVDRMKGLETIVYTVDMSDAVPGTIAAVDIHAPAEGKATFSERLRYVGSSPAINLGTKQP